MKHFIFGLLLLHSTTWLWAADQSKLLHIDIDLSNQASLQRGAKIFRNYCLSCHSATYMRYNRLGEDLGITEKVLRQNFLFADEKIGDTMQIAMRPEQGASYFGVAPPDLSVIARARGADWLYTYLKGFYLDEKRPTGANNLVFRDTAMPHVLWSLQGINKLKDEPSSDQDYISNHVDLLTAGSLSPEEYDAVVKDLVGFLSYLGEPIKLKRSKIGVWVMLYLIVFIIIAYFLKREYWRDIH